MEKPDNSPCLAISPDQVWTLMKVAHTPFVAQKMTFVAQKRTLLHRKDVCCTERTFVAQKSSNFILRSTSASPANSNCRPLVVGRRGRLLKQPLPSQVPVPLFCCRLTR